MSTRRRHYGSRSSCSALARPMSCTSSPVTITSSPPTASSGTTRRRGGSRDGAWPLAEVRLKPDATSQAPVSGGLARAYTARSRRFPMKRTVATVAAYFVASLALAFVNASGQSRAASPVYFPERFGWEHRTPAQVGLNPSLVDEAVQLAVSNESTGSRVMQQYLVESYGREPFDTPIGPIKDRGPASGVLLRRGYIVAEWGEP